MPEGSEGTMAKEEVKQAVLVDNARVRVSELRFAPGAATGHHRHANDYVVVPITAGRLLITDSHGERHRDLATGVPYFREAGVEHDVINDSDHEVSFIKIELK